MPDPAAALATVPAETAELLREVRAMIEASGGRYVTTREILTRLAGSPRWPILRGPIKSAARVLAALFRPAGVRASQVGGWGGENVRGYALAKLAPAFERYLGNQDDAASDLDSGAAHLDSVLTAIEGRVADARRRLEGVVDASLEHATKMQEGAA